ncbi:MAG: cell envelope integrity EipB family protein [Alphaproteobacteria bacterium]|nr:cell envelope integrity EipB family protein [Alphaproteobacteria bacterium]MDX5367766.1 cell envelope integrity EipB family protein [Alphaproteobacteria bacterium]MDX5462649.1 cell envelope integrity EipB family protein [Alphaproteobacteria bacterium]
MTRLFLIAAGMLACLAGGLPAQAAELVSHKAFYALSLRSAAPDAGIATMQGRMAITFDNVCEGYAYEQRIVSEVTDPDGQVRVTDFLVSSYEAKDGSLYRFNHANRFNGVVVERQEGVATARPGESPRVRIEVPEPRDLALPEGVLFPIAHTRDLLASLAAGARTHAVTVFDESTEGFVLLSDSLLLARRAPQAFEDDPRSDQPAWRIKVAYYDPARLDGTPEYEVTLTLYDNGIADELVMDYGDFVVDGELVDLVPGVTGGC